MSNQPKVWLSFPDNYDKVNIYSIGMNIPGLFDYPAYQASSLEYFKNKEDEEIRKKIES